jgi:RsiW-degrading membrane proteinase PrsW (M82 family)
MPLLRAVLGLLPVCALLMALLWFDSFKLVRPRLVVATIAGGGLAALAAWFANAGLLDASGLPLREYSRFVAPLTEEFLKGGVILLLVLLHRIGFLIDAAILGFAVGTGFAAVENLYFLGVMADAPIAVWIVRGFGTALMHGGACAIFAILAQSLIERGQRFQPLAFVPAWLAAALVHAAFNHFLTAPIASTIAVLVLLPPLLWLVYSRSQHTVLDWLAIDWDADAELLRLIDSGELGQSKAGAYLDSIRGRFDGAVLVDMICYLRLHLELELRAKGAMLLRDNGFEVELDEETRGMLAELEHLEGSIGRTGRLALKPVLHLSRRDIWQIYTLGR